MGTAAGKQVYRLAARGMNPQRSVVGGRCNHIGNGVVAHRDDIGVGSGGEGLQVIGRVWAAHGIGQHLGVLQPSAVDLHHTAMCGQPVRQAGGYIS